MECVQRRNVERSKWGINWSEPFDTHTFLPETDHFAEDGICVEGFIARNSCQVLADSYEPEVLREVEEWLHSQGLQTMWIKPKSRVSIVAAPVLPKSLVALRELLIKHNTHNGVTKWDKVVSRLSTQGQYFFEPCVQNQPRVNIVKETLGMVWVRLSYARDISVWEMYRNEESEWCEDVERPLRSGHKLVNGPFMKGIVRVIPDNVMDAKFGNFDVVFGEDCQKIPVEPTKRNIFRRISEYPEMFASVKSGPMPIIWKALLGLHGGNDKLMEYAIKLAEGRLSPEDYLAEGRYVFEEDHEQSTAWATAIWAGIPPNDSLVHDRVQERALIRLFDAVNGLDDHQCAWGTAVGSFPGELRQDEIKIPEWMMRKMRLTKGQEVCLMRSPINGLHAALKVKVLPTKDSVIVIHPKTWLITKGDFDGDRARVTADLRIMDLLLEFEQSKQIDQITKQNQIETTKSFASTEYEAIEMICKSAKAIGPAVNCFTMGAEEAQSSGSIHGTRFDFAVELACEWTNVIQPKIDGLKHGQQEVELPQRNPMLGIIKSAIDTQDLLEKIESVAYGRGPIADQFTKIAKLVIPEPVENDYRNQIYEWASFQPRFERYNLAKKCCSAAFRKLHEIYPENDWSQTLWIETIQSYDQSLTGVEIAIGMAMWSRTGVLAMAKHCPDLLQAALSINVSQDSEDSEVTELTEYEEWDDSESILQV